MAGYLRCSYSFSVSLSRTSQSEGCSSLVFCGIGDRYTAEYYYIIKNVRIWKQLNDSLWNCIWTLFVWTQLSTFWNKNYFGMQDCWLVLVTTEFSVWLHIYHRAPLPGVLWWEIRLGCIHLKKSHQQTIKFCLEKKKRTES